MYFKENEWSPDLFNQYIPTSSALSFDKVRSSLASVDTDFVLPLLGPAMSARAERITDTEPERRTGAEASLLTLMRTATLNLAFYYDFQELNLRITDQGFQRQTTENFSSAYKYQEDALQHNFRNKGFNALDRALDLLESHVEEFPEYESSPAYHDCRRRIVATVDVADGICCIHKSPLVFLRLLPLMRVVEDTELPIILGTRLNKTLRSAIEEGRENESVGDTTYAELRYRCAQFVMFRSCARLVRETGTLTDRGLYFSAIEAGKEGNTKEAPADWERAARLAASFEQSAERYSSALTMYIQQYTPDYFTGHESDVLKRDNDHKRTIWL